MVGQPPRQTLHLCASGAEVAEPAQRATEPARRPAPRLFRAIEADLGAISPAPAPWAWPGAGGWRRPRPACGRRASFLNIHVPYTKNMQPAIECIACARRPERVTPHTTPSIMHVHRTCLRGLPAHWLCPIRYDNSTPFTHTGDPVWQCAFTHTGDPVWQWRINPQYCAMSTFGVSRAASRTCRDSIARGMHRR